MNLSATLVASDTVAKPFEELRIEGIVKSYPGVRALKGVSLSVARGTIHGLAGQNGAGKSTLIKILSGAEEPDAGRIFLAANRCACELRPTRKMPEYRQSIRS